MNRILLYMLLALPFSGNAQHQKLWHFINEGTTNGTIYSFTPCDNSDVIAYGYNTGGDLDPGPSVNTAPPITGGGNNKFLARYTQAGNLLWARPVFYSYTYSPSVYTGKTDSSGNYFFIFRGTDNYAVGPPNTSGTMKWITLGSSASAVVKLDPNGVYDTSFAYDSGIDIQQLCLMPNGSFMIGGTINQAPADLDPGIGAFNVNSVNVNSTYVAYFDSDFNFINAAVFTGGFTAMSGLALDQNNNIYISGRYNGTCDFDPGPGQFLMTDYPPFPQPWSSSDYAKFLVKLDSNFTFQNAFSFARTLTNMNLVTDKFDGLYISGVGLGLSDIDPSPGIELLDPNYPNVPISYLAKFNSNLELVWSKSLPYSTSMSLVKYGVRNTLDFSLQVNDTIVASDFGLPPIYPLNAGGWYSSMYHISLDTSGTACSWIFLGKTGELFNTAFAFSDQSHFFFAGRTMFTYDIEIGPGITAQGCSPGASSNFFISFYATEPYLNHIRGTVFLDLNGNSSKDSGEPGLSNFITSISPGNTYVSTDINGNYGTFVPSGNYQVKVDQYPPALNPPIPSIHQASFNSFNQIDTANNFAFQFNQASVDIGVFITSQTVARPGFPLKYVVTVHNYGSSPQSGDINLLLDSTLSFTNASVTPSFQSGLLVTIPFTNLNPFQAINFDIFTEIDTLVQIGDSILTNVNLSSIPGDIDLSNNSDQSLSLAISSLDPNNKQGIPNGIVSIDSIQAGLWIDYIIRFQNIGNDTAFAVTIIDTLSSFLDLSTLQVVSSSHPYLFTLYPSRLAEINFPDIMLPDSSVNYDLSNGFFRYRIKARQDLFTEQIILNKAYIYFDYNDPEVTNCTSLEIQDATGISEFNLNSDYQIFPNPSQTGFTLTNKHDLIKEATISLLNYSGSIVYQKPVSTLPIYIDTTQLPSGVYTCVIKSAKKTNFIKVVKLN